MSKENDFSYYKSEKKVQQTFFIRDFLSNDLNPIEHFF
jgi:hypothetical protein